MNLDEFFAEARRLNCRMVSDDPAEVRAALDAKDAEIELLRLALSGLVDAVEWTEGKKPHNLTRLGRAWRRAVLAIGPIQSSPKPQADPPAA